MTDKTLPVAFFDSGLGGISVLRETVRMLPHEDFLYYGDSLHAPYGVRPVEEVVRLSRDAVQLLLGRGIKAFVIACNTATAASVSKVRQLMNQYSMPIISIEPAIKPACALPGTGKVFMMATLATTRLNRYLALQARMPDPSRVINIPCPGIVERVEAGIFDDDAYDDLFDKYFAPYVGTEVDAIVLGCTHYPLLRSTVREIMGEGVNLVNPAYETAVELRRLLSEQGIANDGKTKEGEEKYQFYVSDAAEKFMQFANSILPYDIEQTQLIPIEEY